MENLPADIVAGPGFVAVELEARPFDWEIEPGHRVAGYAFNAEVPGPTIEANAGDTVVVRLKNSLPEPTAIHWHGLRVPASMDGTEMSQRPIAPGDTFEYRFVVPDAATFWYHPHVHESEQIERGLYGAFIVRGKDEPVLDRERLLVLDDLKLDRTGRIAKFGGWRERHDGRLGEVRLVNGEREPELEPMLAGQVERWRVINASNARYVRLAIGDRPFKIIGTDGGLLPAPLEATDVLLAPADRVDLAVGPFEEGELLHVRSLDVGARRGGPYAAVRVGPQAVSRAVLPATLRAITPLVGPGVPPTRAVRLGGKLSLRRGVDFLINGEQHFQDEPVRVGELQVWDVVNETMMDHPFHLHGFFFQVVEENGVAPRTLSWEDTVNVPRGGYVRIAWIPDDRPGSWMYHCHILEHHAAGMMAHFDVVR